MRVIKFGGTSVSTPALLKVVKRIAESGKKPCVVVVSALSGVTDELCNVYNFITPDTQKSIQLFNKVVARHIEFTESLHLKKADIEYVTKQINQISEETILLIRNAGKKKSCDEKVSDQILSTGERFSSQIISGLVTGSQLIDSRQLIITSPRPGPVHVDINETEKRIKEKINGTSQIYIVPGFIASDSSGNTTTLGRGGSDYTASLIAATLDASSLEIWTDVDGFMSADPKKVEKAYTIPELTYAEAMELSHFGAKVIYTPTVGPVYRKKIPLSVKNTFNPDSSGTLIHSHKQKESQSPIKGISSIDKIDLLTLQGPAMVGITGTSARLFGALAKSNVNIIMITQASSEFSITFAIRPEDTKAASAAISDEFSREIEGISELRLNIEKNLSIIAVVGEQMKNTPGISATLFRSLSKNGISAIATAQGSSELNISVVIKHEQLRKALNVIHDGFFLSQLRELNLFIAGTGVVGSTLLKQLAKQEEKLLNEHNLKVNIKGITDSQVMVISEHNIPPSEYREILKKDGSVAEIKDYTGKVRKLNLRNSVFVDCTADPSVALEYLELFKGYISVVTANKIACSSEYPVYQHLKQEASKRSVRFFYETTVGAGLPVIKTIADLVVSGDKILGIEAVLSGTLNFIFNEIGPDMPLSMAIKRAKELGYSEPDPRTDLSGTDVVRKILILTREAGYSIEKEDVVIESFLPDSCFEGDLKHFYSEVEKIDADFEKRRLKLEKAGKKWRFFATYSDGKAKVGLREIDAEHPSYNLAGSNNIVLLTTERYKELPMVIKGYGAGAEVTAAGVFSDLMRVINL